jgi:arylsulfatase
MKSDAMNGKGLKRGDLLLGRTSLAAGAMLPATRAIRYAQAQPASAAIPAGGGKPNILFIISDNIGWFNVST